jgi:serine phosphatase RsbU (regulator of sigma subunit)
MIADNSGKLWISTNSGITSFDQKNSKTRHLDANDGLLDQVFSDRLVSQSFSGLQLFGGNRFIVAFQPDSIAIDNSIPKVEFVEVVLSGKNDNKIKNIAEHDTLEIEPKYHYIKISFSLLDFWAPFKNRYKYSIEKIGSQTRWIYLDGQNYLILSGLKAGYYKLCIRGSNNENTWNENSSDLVIHVIAPFWQSRIAFLMYGIVTIIIFYFTIFFRTKHLLKLNREHRQKEQIAKKVEQQKEELSFKNKNITDSIYYAKRIQEALMPSHKLFRKFFPDSFILHIPKDIVSGDFYWINEVDNRVYFAAVDCTGHGVPGAFMSIIGFELFRRITETEKKRQPAEILNGLSHGFKTFFRDVENYTVRDGMDVAFCAIDKERKYLEYAGAFNPLYLARDNTITEIKGDRFSVGLYDDAEVEQNKYKNHLIPLIDGDIIYIFTDGFADQFGGPEGKKYKYRRFRLLLLSLLQLPMERQFEFLRKSINDWKGELDQVDDILIMGIRISHEK